MKPILPAILLAATVSLTTARNIDKPSTRSAATCGDPGVALPFYRGFKSTTVDHFYTTKVDLVDNSILAGYALQGVAALVFVTQEESTVPFYRLWKASATDNFYTTSTTERDNAIQNGYVLWTPDPQTYIYPTQICGSVPFYRLYNSAQQDNFYTTSESERLDFITQGYTDIEIAGYVLPVASTQCD
ncbi:hypothetical protein B0H14DRAFT_2559211 [Mycena olivaceomarginata]|nr:hypothetical protein B0H14DRAFT_2559211 [Mycena olivaceomarginata]